VCRFPICGFGTFLHRQRFTTPIDSVAKRIIKALTIQQGTRNPWPGRYLDGRRKKESRALPCLGRCFERPCRHSSSARILEPR
jgi:hypothetical protein